LRIETSVFSAVEFHENELANKSTLSYSICADIARVGRLVSLRVHYIDKN